jgi:hypothetical protein
LDCSRRLAIMQYGQTRVVYICILLIDRTLR